MAKKNNLFLVDMPVDKENWGVLKGLREKTGLLWTVKYREGRLSVPTYKRMLNFLFFPLSILSRNTKTLVSWQQFYGIFYLFYNKLFKINKDVAVTIMTFIFKERGGLLGKLYKAFVSFSIDSPNLQNIVVFSRNEVQYYSLLFPKAHDKFKFVPLGMEYITGLSIDEQLREEKYIFTAGSSNRDYDFLISLLNNTDYKMKIACHGLHKEHGGNIEILQNVHGDAMYRYLYNCEIVVIPLQNLEVSSGQLMLLQAMQMGKPIIVSNNKGVYDYIEDGKTGYIVDNRKEQWMPLIKELYNDPVLYKSMSERQKETFKRCFSAYALGRNTGELIK